MSKDKDEWSLSRDQSARDRLHSSLFSRTSDGVKLASLHWILLLKVASSETFLIWPVTGFLSRAGHHAEHFKCCNVILSSVISGGKNYFICHFIQEEIKMGKSATAQCPSARTQISVSRWCVSCPCPHSQPCPPTPANGLTSPAHVLQLQNGDHVKSTPSPISQVSEG